MSRHPADLTMGVPPRQFVWDILRFLGEVSLGELSMRSGQPLSLCKDYLWALRKAGIVEEARQEKGPLDRPRTVYRLVRDLGLEAPRVRKNGALIPASGRQRMSTLR